MTPADPHGSPPSTDEYLLAFRLMAAINLQNNPRYADSWCRRGEQGIFHNIGRKFDRLEQQILSGQHAEPNETMDLAVYAWMHLAWQLRNNPRPLLEWFDKEFGVVGESDQPSAA